MYFIELHVARSQSTYLCMGSSALGFSVLGQSFRRTTKKNCKNDETESLFFFLIWPERFSSQEQQCTITVCHLFGSTTIERRLIARAEKKVRILLFSMTTKTIISALQIVQFFLYFHSMIILSAKFARYFRFHSIGSKQNNLPWL